MKQRIYVILILCIAFSFGLNAIAQNPDLRLFLTNGQNIVISLVDESNDPLEVYLYGYEEWEKEFDYYDENALFVVIGEHRFLFPEVSHYRISGTSDIKSITDTNTRETSLKFEFNGNILNIYNSKNSNFFVYNMSGVRLSSDSYVSGDVVTIDLSNLPLGLYIISNGEQSIKFIKK